VSATASRICVAHLVHAANGLEALERFLRSYRAHDAGAEHDLVLLLKGFDGAAAARRHVELAGPGAGTLLVGSAGYDLGAYWSAVERLPHELLVFVNSFSEVLAADWLGKLTRALDDPSVGVAGATGSWNSQRGYLAYQLGLPSPYAEAFPSRRAARLALLALHGDRDRGWMLHKAGTARDYLLRLRGLGTFPAPHLRTNAFAASRELLACVAPPPIRAKHDAHRFESGPQGLTGQVRALGLRCVVVGRDGVSYDIADWPRSHTFNQAGQENLLVADNRTTLYDASDATGRQYLAWLAWGRDGHAA
jgi:hypothetical protein